MARFAHFITAIDSHTAGEPTRIIVSGLPPILGSTIPEKWAYVRKNMDHLRRALMHEPRGHRDMFGAILTTPCRPEADFGLMFMDSGGFLTMCGHGTIGTATVLVEMGMVEAKEPETVVVFDTPAGLVEGHVVVEGGRAKSAWIENVASFLFKGDVPVDVKGLGKIKVDISFGGNFFALTTAEEVGVPVEEGRARELVDIGLRVRDAVNEQVKVQHPVEKHIDKVELTEITGRAIHKEAHARNIVIFGEGSFDRSPCGTGTSARMAAMYAKGELKIKEPFAHESVIGTIFRGELVREVNVGGFKGAVPRISSPAYITGIQQFVIDPDDPMKNGFFV
jgi:proline racemase/trans-L-3-hydroxyproline dehydratase